MPFQLAKSMINSHPNIKTVSQILQNYFEEFAKMLNTECSIVINA